ncbi:MAG: putative PEP-binding protein, partial [Thermomicrobiales bacterium]
FRAGEVTVQADDEISIDGASGRVFRGRVETVQPDLGGGVETLLRWADDLRRLGIRANADTPVDAARARQLGAEGIGLCRTEHMFFGGDRIDTVRQMILAETDDERDAALARLEEFQTADFTGLFRAMDGLPVVIRTLDPPLHEFLPHSSAEIARLARRLGRDANAVELRIAALREANPMLGHRGCRLGLTFPSVTRMQTRAIFRAALACAAEGIQVEPEIMIPLVVDPEELRREREIVTEVADQLFARAGREVHYVIGTMIELPRAALLAGELAPHASFFSFGTNDLTQTTFGMSRDDSGRFLPHYLEQGIFPADPFQVLDRSGVGRLIALAVEQGRRARPELMTCVCGEHGGEPSSIAFCHEVGLDYVSCSPFRVPVARLAAAHAALAEGRTTSR